MAKKDGSVSQVHEFMVVGPDAHGLPDELAETPVSTAPGRTDEPKKDDNIPENDPYAGPQNWVIKWFGPFFNLANLPAASTMGLYLCYVGNYPLFVSSTANMIPAISKHIIFSGHQIIPIDLLGREILHYANLRHQQLSIKTGLIFNNNRLIHPQKHLYCYRRAAAAIAFAHATPCNKYARLSYDFDPLCLTNLGKAFPLKESIHVEPTPTASDD